MEITSPPMHLLLQAEQTLFFQPCLIPLVLQPLDHLGSLPWSFLQSYNIFLVLQSSKLDTEL